MYITDPGPRRCHASTLVKRFLSPPRQKALGGPFVGRDGCFPGLGCELDDVVCDGLESMYAVLRNVPCNLQSKVRIGAPFDAGLQCPVVC